MALRVEPPPHPVPAGPLALRWHALELDPLRAGALARARVDLENAGWVRWRSGEREGIQLAYHWLDERGNPIVWDGLRTPFEPPLEPGERRVLELRLRAPLPAGRYRLALDLVDERRFWFAEVGNPPLELECEVAPRIERRLGVRVDGEDTETRRALAAQEEPLVPEEEAAAVAVLARGCLPPPSWSRQLLDAHQEGYAVVGGSVAPLVGPLRRRPAALAPWAPGTGRLPHFAHPLLCPSVVRELEVALDSIEGLPALVPPPDEPWLYDGRIALTARLRSGRRRG